MTREEFDAQGFKVGDFIIVDDWSNGCYIKAITRHYIITSTEKLDGLESPWEIKYYHFLHYKAPEPQERWARAAIRSRDKIVGWYVTECLYSSFESAKLGFEFLSIIWPARFDSDGFLIIPEEFK